MPNFINFIYESDLEKHEQINDIVSTLFGAMPMSMLKFLNIEIKRKNNLYSWSTFEILTFGSSVLEIILCSINLIHYLY